MKYQDLTYQEGLPNCLEVGGTNQLLVGRKWLVMISINYLCQSKLKGRCFVYFILGYVFTLICFVVWMIIGVLIHVPLY